MVLPGLLFGTLNVLGPLRLDALGAGAIAIAACFLALTLVCAASFAVLWRARSGVAAAHG